MGPTFRRCAATENPLQNRRPRPMAAPPSGASGASGASGEDVIRQRSPSPPLGNVQGAQFCLHSCSHFDGGMLGDNLDHDLSSQASTSPRSSVLSILSTSSAATECDCTTPAAANHTHCFPHASHSPFPAKRSRRDRELLHAARLQRSRRDGPLLGSNANSSKTSSKHWTNRSRSSSHNSTADALAALEPSTELNLTKMSTLEQQRWINVQQKTFTKWYAQSQYGMGNWSPGFMICQPMSGYGETLPNIRLQVKYKISIKGLGGQGSRRRL